MIEFTQYIRPNGRRAQVSIERSAEIEALAVKILERGARFECEHLSTGHASLTVHYLDEDIAIHVVENAPGVVGEGVDRLVRDAAKKMGVACAGS